MLKTYIMWLAFLFVPVLAAAEEVSCKCEQAQCKPCEVAIEQPTFYTAKCGPGNSKIKSCARVTCEPVPEQKKCLAELANQSPAERALAAKAEAPTGSSKGAALSVEAVGVIGFARGEAKLIRIGGAEQIAQLQQPVFEGDVIETGADGQVGVVFKDDNKLNVTPHSRVTVEKQTSGAKGGPRRTLLNLMYGKIRTKVNKKNSYDGANNTFQVRTKTAVAGVRGTDFVTTFTPSEKNWITEIKTFEGHVEFGGDSRSDHVDVRQGEAASFIIAAPASGEVSGAQLRSYIDKGVLSEVRRMIEKESEKLDQDTDFETVEGAEASLRPRLPSREPAAATPFEPVCNEPAGDLKWCSYTCEGNPAGESQCNTRLPGVRCVRRICNANGRWAEPTTLPKKAWSACEPTGVSARRDCGEY
ncbi:MAG: FecR domain-containing protein [Bdellovibrionaceae bacterium]|nr:FecR domain-containing protein [Pseudobdellovibrionaceae bacterium]